MPVNEILAPSYVKLFYETYFGRQHVVRFYFDGAVSEVTPGQFTITPSVGAPFTLDTFIHDEFSVRAAGNGNGTGWVINSIEVWTSAAGVNTFEGYQVPREYGGYNHGTGTPHAAVYTQHVFAAGNRKLFRFTLMDGGITDAQRTPGATPPLVDNASLEWMFLNGGFGLVTNDNYALRVYRSKNVSYHKKLYRSYGRNL